MNRCTEYSVDSGSGLSDLMSFGINPHLYAKTSDGFQMLLYHTTFQNKMQVFL